ncbi:MAG: CBS domain-containing protein [Elusimicrobiota bacterium]
MLKVKDCLFEKQKKVERGTTLKEIIKIFRNNRSNNLPVVDSEGRIVGRIALEEILSVFQPHSAEINQLLKTVPFLDNVPEEEIDIDFITPEMGILIVADEIMNRQLLTIRPENTIAEAFAVMKANQTEFLIVTDDENRLNGTLEMFDIMYAIFTEKGVIY